ncbi:MAG: ATP-binding protein [Solobacterium sp.]|nr:ATP-binding protein [Solobacterium sp.]
MFYFREDEIEAVTRFSASKTAHAMAVYGRRRAGKTQLITHCKYTFLEHEMVYFQVSSGDYIECLKDFTSTVQTETGEDTILSNISSFKDVFVYLEKVMDTGHIFVIDEFPVFAKRNSNVALEFQWIIDHSLKKHKLILMGSQLSFMKKQIYSDAEPLYGRFHEVLHLLPFTFEEVNTLFPDFHDAMKVYATTGGVAQYVAFCLDYPSVDEALSHLFFNKDGRLFSEADNLLMMELRDLTSYKKILRAIGYTGKTLAQIASKCGVDQRAVLPYIERLIELDIVNESNIVLSQKRQVKRYRITDLLFRFTNSFIEENKSFINIVGKDSMEHILDNQFNEFLGVAYEEIIRVSLMKAGIRKEIPFVAKHIGEWFGNVSENDTWHETQVDVIAYDDKNLIIGECKYTNKAIGMNILDKLKLKGQFISSGDRKKYYALASSSGFTDEVINAKGKDVILIHGTTIL